MKRVEKKGFKLKLVTNVAELGLLQPLAKTRGHLIVSAVVATGLYFALCLFVAHYVNHISSSVGLNLALITISMLALLVAAYVQAMLFGDLFFPGRWRERVLLGTKSRFDAQSPDAVDPTLHRDFNLHFLAIVAVLVGGNYFAMSTVTDDFLDEYHEMGFHLTRLRSDVDSEKIRALKELSKTIYAERWHEKRVSKAVTSELNNPAEEVQLWALYATRQAGYVIAYGRLKEMLEGGSVKKRAETALTLGSLSDKRATAHLALFLSQDREPEEIVGAIRGLNVLGDPAGAKAIAPFIDSEDALVVSHAYWALGQLKHTPIYDKVMTIFEEAVGEARCGPLVYLLYNARTEGIQDFKDLFTTTVKDEVCPYVIWEKYNEDKVYVIYKESHRAKYMKYIANAAGQKERDWFIFIAADKERPYELRLLASDIIREIDRR